MRRSLWEFLTSAGAPSSAAREALRAATWVVNVMRDNNDPDIYLAISNLQILPRPLHVSLPDAEDGRRRPAWPREACPGQGSGAGSGAGSGVGPPPPTHHSLAAVGAAGRLASPRPSLGQVARLSEAELLLQAAGPERQNRGLASGLRPRRLTAMPGLTGGVSTCLSRHSRIQKRPGAVPRGAGTATAPLGASAPDAVRREALRSVLGQPSSGTRPTPGCASGPPGSVRAPQLSTEFFAWTKRSNGPGKCPAVHARPLLGREDCLRLYEKLSLTWRTAGQPPTAGRAAPLPGLICLHLLPW